MQGMGVLGMKTSPRPAPPHQVAAILTLPFDVVKTQRQVALGAVEAVRGEGPSWHGVGTGGSPSRVLLGMPGVYSVTSARRLHLAAAAEDPG